MPAERNVIMQCARCPLEINSSIGQFVVCGGPCEKIFHITCANVQMDQLQFFARNVLWMCEKCLSAFHDWKKRLEMNKFDSAALSIVSKDIDTLKNQVTEIVATVGSLSSGISSSSSSSTVVRHSTPIVCSTRSSDGSNAYYNSGMRTVDAADDSCMQSEPAAAGSNETEENSDDDVCCQLFLSNIDCKVTESEIEMMVCRSLNAPIEDCRNVKKLVPKWMQGSTSGYISFKVELNRKWERKAMTAATWPCGIKYRKFVNRQITPWKPIL